MKLRLQLHELADRHSFLLGCIVLDMCTIPTYPSGDCTDCNPDCTTEGDCTGHYGW